MANSLLDQLEPAALPRHIGLIMDGNGRWAKKRGLPRRVGHKQGADVLGKIVRHCQELGIAYVTAYAFSTENWKRPPEEVDAIMELLRQYLDDLQTHEKENVRLCFLGEREQFPADFQEKMERAERASAKNTGIQVNMALNYGGRRELLHAMQTLARQCCAGTLLPEEIDEAKISGALFTAGIPDPDVIIRPSGEKRTSNFLPWQSVYTELVFMDVLWPDFTPKHLDAAILEYAGRARRFGGI